MIKTFEQFTENESDLIKLKKYHDAEILPFFKKIGFDDVKVNFELWSDPGKKDPTQFNN